jgi:hypothetical protein
VSGANPRGTPAPAANGPEAYAATDPPPPLVDPDKKRGAGRSDSSVPPGKRRRGSRTAWLVTLLVTSILGGVVFLVATGQLEIRPQGQVADMAQKVAQELNLPSPVASGERADDAPSKSGLPASLEPAFARLVAAESRDERVEAANAVLGHMPPDEVPVYVRRMAYLQLAATCAEKRDEIEKLAEIGDSRVLPLLVRIAQKPRSGCGKRRREDCLACLRKPLEDLIEALEKKRQVAAP